MRGLKEVLSQSWLPTVGVLFHPAYLIINAAICGRLGDKQLAGFGLGSLTIGIVGISIGTSFAYSVGTLIAQAAGAGDLRMCRVYLYRQYYLNSLIFPVQCLPLLFIRRIFDAMGQDADVSDYAAQYVWTCLPGLYFLTQSFSSIQFAVSQKYTSAQLLTFAVAALCHAIMIYVLVFWLEWGYTGVCVSSSIQFVVRFLVAHGFNQIAPDLKNIHNVSLFSRETFSSCGYQFRLGFMGMLMGVWGWWAFDIFTLMASYLSIQIVSAQTIMRSLGLLTFMAPVGFSISCGILIGRSIGEGSETKIRFYYKICMMLSIVVAFAVNLVLLSCEDFIITLFTDLDQVGEHIRDAWTVFNFFIVFDTTQFIASAVIRAAGQQRFGAALTFIAYFFLGIPLAYVLVYHYGLKLSGIWMGPIVACAFNTVAYIVIFLRTDWQKLIADMALQREKDKFKNKS